MSPFTGKRVVVFHAGALGDLVLIWPLLRALQNQAQDVCVIAASSHAELAERELGIRGLSSERPWVTALWRENTSPRQQHTTPSAAHPHADVVVSFVADELEAAGRVWCTNAAQVLNASHVICAGPPGSTSRTTLWALANVAALGGVQPRASLDGPVVLHAGAGSRDKMWPMSRWVELALILRTSGRAVRVIAGHVEQERFDCTERTTFAEANGAFVASLGELTSLLHRASAFVGSDTGPTHLAAQLGVPTFALFGPTNPAIWGPVGPRVCIARAPSEQMADLPTRMVLEQLSTIM